MGEKAYSAGGDLKTCKDAPTRDFWNNYFTLYDVNAFNFSKLPFCHVALIHGYSWGAGAAFSQYADLRVTTETTNFCMPESQLGLFPNGGGTFFLIDRNKINPSVGLFMGLSGK